MKKLFIFFLCCSMLLFDVGFAEKEKDGSQYNNLANKDTFKTGTVTSNTKICYSTINFIATVITGNGSSWNGEFFKEYNYGGSGKYADYSEEEFEEVYGSVDGSWQVFGGVSISDVLSSDCDQGILQDICQSGCEVYLDPRFEIAVSEEYLKVLGMKSTDITSTTTKYTSDAGIKTFYVVDTDLNSVQAEAAASWSEATSASFAQQHYTFSVAPCNHDKYCEHGEDWEEKHKSLTNRGYLVEVGMEKRTCPATGAEYEKMWCKYDKKADENTPDGDSSGELWKNPPGCSCEYKCNSCGAKRLSDGTYKHPEFFIESGSKRKDVCNNCKKNNETLRKEIKTELDNLKDEEKELKERKKKVLDEGNLKGDELKEWLKEINEELERIAEKKEKLEDELDSISDNFYVPKCKLHTHIGEPVCPGHYFDAAGDAVGNPWLEYDCGNTDREDMQFERKDTNNKLFSVGDSFSLYEKPAKFTHVDNYRLKQMYERICGRTKQIQCEYIDPRTNNQCQYIKYGGQCGEPSGSTVTKTDKKETERNYFTNSTNVVYKGIKLDGPDIDGKYKIKAFEGKNLTKVDLPKAHIVCKDVTDPNYRNLPTSYTLAGLTKSITHCPAPVFDDIIIDFPINLIGDDPINPNSTPLPNGEPDNPTRDDDPKSDADPDVSDDNPNVDADEVGRNGLFVLSVRDLRWMQYMDEMFAVPFGDNCIIDVDDAELNEIKFGYAIECLFKARNFSEDELDININPSVVEYPGIRGSISELKSETSYTSSGVPVTRWTWYYYLPLDASIDKNGDPITVKFDIELLEKEDGNVVFDYLDYVKNGYKGKIFQYSTKHDLLEDIYNNSNN